ncbi:MAG: hypothetical protein KGL39_51500 [Patescibacteria group bacterium]|nr:hypothetical protein [Patescibacteria group bacterium]
MSISPLRQDQVSGLDAKTAEQSRRLLAFAADVDQHAAMTHDQALAQLVNNLHGDLMDIAGDNDD